METTPWVLQVQLHRLEQHPEQISNEKIQLYWAVASVIPVDGLDAGAAVASMNDLLAESYLWPVDEQSGSGGGGTSCWLRHCLHLKTNHSSSITVFNFVCFVSSYV